MGNLIGVCVLCFQVKRYQNLAKAELAKLESMEDATVDEEFDSMSPAQSKSRKQKKSPSDICGELFCRQIKHFANNVKDVIGKNLACSVS